MAKVELYGLLWESDYCPLQREFYMIRKGGQWKDAQGREFGKGLLFHYLEARRLLWPQRYRHRWTDLIYSEILKNEITILMGAASTQKSSHIAEWCLIDYWSYPKNTFILISTINVDKLETNIFGEIKMLFQDGRDRFPDLDGHLLDHKHAITTQTIKDEDFDDRRARDMRQGIMGRPCFPTGTLVDTPSGPKTIESLRVGDEVINACGVGRVKETMSRFSGKLVRVKINDGRYFDCTINHPVFTDRGWVNAIDLKTSDKVFSADETLSLLQRTTWGGLSEPEILFSCVPKSRHGSDLRFVQTIVSSLETKSRKVLQQSVCGKMGLKTRLQENDFEKMRPLQQAARQDSFQASVLLCSLSKSSRCPPVSKMREAIHISTMVTEKETILFLQSVLLREVEGKENLKNQQRSYSARIKGLESIHSAMPVELFGSHWHFQKRWPKTLVQSGYCVSQDKIGGGDRWRGSQHTTGRNEGQSAYCPVAAHWVESVEILKRSGDPRFDESEAGYRVHNLEVSGHPSYSVNGVIVHNCYVGQSYVGLGVFAGIKQERFRFVGDELQWMAPTFMDAWTHMFSNPDCKIVGSGNPNHDPDDQMGLAAEPELGWTSLPEPEKTTVWKTKRLGGVCVNLVGTDSPNFDFPTDRYPRLIGRKFVQRTEHDCGKDSPEYYRLVKGVMKLGFAHARVITRQLCSEHHAHDTALWAGTQRTKIHALDPAYGGGDRCVSMWGEFGKDIEDRMILRLNPPRIIRINLQNPRSPEDQIADEVYKELEANGIPPENSFYDSFGKGTIGFAFARRFGTNCPVPVDSGARCSDRPVRYDLFVYDESLKHERLKRCNEHYSKFVTEMWFSCRYAIEAEQIRELPEEVMAEGCWREYYTVAGDKFEVEPKDDMREKKGKSPDLFDAFAVLVEGARRRGFQILKLGSDLLSKSDGDWFVQDAEEFDADLKEHLLIHQ